MHKLIKSLNFDLILQKWLGVWFNRAIKFPDDVLNFKCVKDEYKSLDLNTITERNEWITLNDNSLKSSNQSYKSYANAPGLFNKYIPVNEAKFSGPAPVTVLYTDYTNILVHYSCKIDGSWYSKKKKEMVLISIRKREFNDLDKFLFALEKLRSYKIDIDIEDLIFILNDKSCTN